MMQTDTEFSGVLNLCSADWTTMSSYLTSVITNMDSMCREEGSLHVSLYSCMWWINILLQIFLHVFKFSGLVPAEKKKILSSPDFSQNGSLLCSCEIGIQFGAHGPVSTSRDALVLPVCSVNQWFPGEACLKLFKLSARSLEGNLKSADKLLCPPQHLPHLALPHICHSCHLPDLLWADLFKHAQRYFYVQINLFGVLRFVSEISGEHWSICCVFAAQAPCCSMSYLAELSWHFSYSYIPGSTVHW